MPSMHRGTRWVLAFATTLAIASLTACSVSGSVGTGKSNNASEAGKGKTCDLQTVDGAVRAINGGHDYPKAAGLFTDGEHIAGLKVICAGDYHVNFSNTPGLGKLTSLAIVSGDDVIKKVQKSLPAGTQNTASDGTYAYFEAGHDIVAIKPFDDNSGKWFFEMIHDEN